MWFKKGTVGYAVLVATGRLAYPYQYFRTYRTGLSLLLACLYSTYGTVGTWLRYEVLRLETVTSARRFEGVVWRRPAKKCKSAIWVVTVVSARVETVEIASYTRTQQYHRLRYSSARA